MSTAVRVKRQRRRVALDQQHLGVRRRRRGGRARRRRRIALDDHDADGPPDAGAPMRPGARANAAVPPPTSTTLSARSCGTSAVQATDPAPRQRMPAEPGVETVDVRRAWRRARRADRPVQALHARLGAFHWSGCLEAATEGGLRQVRGGSDTPVSDPFQSASLFVTLSPPEEGSLGGEAGTEADHQRPVARDGRLGAQRLSSTKRIVADDMLP